MRPSFSMQLIPALLATIALVSAQCAPGFPVQVDTNLRVEYQSTNTDVDPAGALLQREDLLDTPTVQGPKGSTRTLTFMLFMIDQDVSDNSGQRKQFLHFFEPNLSGASEVLFADSSVPNSTDASRVDYLAPSPPAGDGPHSYTFLLYRQPKGFQIPSSFSAFFPPSDTSARLGFDTAGFAQAADLGEATSANWFQVQNGEAVASSSSSSPSVETSTSISTFSEAASTSTEAASVATFTSAETTSTESTAPAFTITTASAAASTASFSSEETVSAESTSVTDVFTFLTSTATDSAAVLTSTAVATFVTATQASSSAATASSSGSTSATASSSPEAGSAACAISARGSLGSLIAGFALALMAGAGMLA
ncbi:hypothetical protein A1O1_02425 [Capronia coronata CBS 617.96]|uniref:Phosphatidylethanolamine-binding protein n=1 Tax=Capronia coronata CBS 617.96 TaxID=1182541 RepID=W9YM89_9EURO|nr:uncharacterized protein A1O1_02425 [Capronia coronata CBS 617.96]EXJ94032.1 hypothetical protein A1O1_02425 [Capronia coronata CBS 617.96]